LEATMVVAGGYASQKKEFFFLTEKAERAERSNRDDCLIGNIAQCNI